MKLLISSAVVYSSSCLVDNLKIQMFEKLMEIAVCY